MPPLFQDTWPRVQLVCRVQGNDQTDLQCQATRHCNHQIQWATCAAWYWGSGPHSEEEKAPLVWTCGMLQWCSRQPFTYMLRESVGLRGQRWHGSSWQRGIAESGSSRLSTLMIDIPGDLVWDLPKVQQTSYLEGGPLVWICPCTCTLIKNQLTMMMMMMMMMGLGDPKSEQLTAWSCRQHSRLWITRSWVWI